MSDNEEIQYSCQVDGEPEARTTSRGVTGKVLIRYPNGDVYEGGMVKGVIYLIIFSYT